MLHTAQPDSAKLSTSWTLPRLSAFVRIALALQTAAIFFQAVTAGLLLSSQYGEVLHSAGARGMYAAAMLYLLATILVWRPGGGPARPILYATGFLLLASLQVVLGIAHVASVHVPLGVLMFAGSVLQLAKELYERRPTRAQGAAAGGVDVEP
ncbi:hypothetical protein [Streptomyces sp. cmx-4-9]|uniref:hypothetical protein n=1 Tax=Streptomyces sp. cmx-4-9 TaxID=2790941 RepID=UPI00398028F8